MSIAYNDKLGDVSAAFAAVGDDGTVLSFTGDPWVPDMVASHVQGVCYVNGQGGSDGYVIVSHNNKGYGNGFLCINNRVTMDLTYTLDTPDQDFNHPGGIQQIGDFVAVPVEMADATKASFVNFLDTSAMNDTSKPVFLKYNVERRSGKAGAVGITNRTVDGAEVYVLLVYDNGAVDVYTSNQVRLDSPDIAFSPAFSARMDDTDLTSTCLLTDQSQEVYVVGFRTTGLGGSNEDHARLYSLDFVKHGISYIEGSDRHFHTDHGGGVAGVAGVHFRYGAGLLITGADSIELFATQRNYVANNLYWNEF